VTTDTRAIVQHLAAFYDFAGRLVLDLGAGGGQLAGYARDARAVIAVDVDRQALDRLAARLRELGLADRFTLVADDLLDVTATADVVLLEFCLHQMADPDRALRHARGLAPDVLVLDHAPGSSWSGAAAEVGLVQSAWDAVARQTVRRERSVEAWQRFGDHEELAAKLAGCGPESEDRIRQYRGQTMISIPMPYRMALL
jgi:SAM-dependent methyltransferase